MLIQIWFWQELENRKKHIKKIKKKSLSEINLPPFKRAEINIKQNNKCLGDYLRQSIKIHNNLLLFKYY